MKLEMSAQCPQCAATNPTNARFCALCGAPLRRARTATCATTCTSTRRDLVLAGVAASAILAAAIVVAVVRNERSDDNDFVPGPIVRHDFTLSDAKADALYNLLKPRDIAVIVGRDAGRLYVEGTRGEVDALVKFVDILNRVERLPRHQHQQRMDQLRKTWTNRRTYRLTSAKSRRLKNVLAFDDVPVLVSRSGPRITVESSDEDRPTIDRIIDILRRRRF